MVIIGWPKHVRLLKRQRPFLNSAVRINKFNGCRERWQEFEQKARAGQSAEIELSADDINALIATSEDVRGKVFTSIDGNQLRLQASLPIGGFLGRPGYYFNGDVIIELKGAQSLDSPRFSRITINGEQVPTGFLGLEVSFQATARVCGRAAERVRDRHH